MVSNEILRMKINEGTGYSQYSSNDNDRYIHIS